MWNNETEVILKDKETPMLKANRPLDLVHSAVWFFTVCLFWEWEKLPRPLQIAAILAYVVLMGSLAHTNFRMTRVANGTLCIFGIASFLAIFASDHPLARETIEIGLVYSLPLTFLTSLDVSFRAAHVLSGFFLFSMCVLKCMGIEEYTTLVSVIALIPFLGYYCIHFPSK